MSDFVHLHNHTHYSLQDAAATVDGLIDACQYHNMHALALTDHGVMYGVSEFYKKATKNNIKPIIGVEAYVKFEGSRFEKGSDKIGKNGKKRTRDYNHLVLLAKNQTGYRNLVKLTSTGFIDGFYYKPRIDLDLIREYKEGLICTSACLNGPVSEPLINGDYERAKRNSIILKEIFGDDFYLELQDHGLEDDKPILEGVPKLSHELGIKMIATNDIHYIEQDHAYAHNILLHLSDKSGNVDYRNLRYRTDQIYFKSSNEMKKLFGGFKGSIENTLEIEEKIDLQLKFGEFHYPQFPIPKESPAKNLDEYFELLAQDGLQKRYSKMNTSIEDRFKYEVKVIKEMGYSGYFLIVQDFINAAKLRGIPVGPGRGSAAGSLVAYALGITNVDPLNYDLLFERFLNPARKSMPDIDVDFADDQRGEVIDYVKEKYGESSVCQIVTFNRLSSKAVLRDVARVLNIPIPQVDKITKFIPSKFGKVYSIEKALKEVPELKWVNESTDPQIKDLIKYSKVLEGMNRNLSKHAAGVVIAPAEVSNFVPLAKAGGAEGDVVTQYNMKELEDHGLLKMDFLGLRTLTIIRDTIELVKETRGIEVDIETIPHDDEKTFELFAKGQTTAVFQFESGAMREYLKKLKPTGIKDLSAMNALYRPGPMDFINDFIDRKHGRKEATYLHHVLEEILGETYGIIVYQEQVIKIANIVAGMSLAEADILRRAMGKKDLKAMAEQRKKFIEGAVENKIPKKAAEEIFDNIDKFANYGFNKSHSVAYSFVAYQTAYLKAHYLPEFLAANLTNEFGNTDKVTVFLDDCRKNKVEVLQPDVNVPSVYFSVKDGKIVFGMSAIKNVGIGAVEELIRTHNELGRDFRTIFDLCAHVDNRLVNKRALEGLVLAGAMDALTGSRAQNFAAIESAIQFGNKVTNLKSSNENSLFGEASEEVELNEPELPDIEPWDQKEKLAKERQVLGFYLSDHPLRKYSTEYESFANIHLGEPDTFENKDESARACGVITSMRTKIDRSGNTMAFFSLDDFSGSCECLMFAKIYTEYGSCIQTENTVLIEGKLESTGDMVKFHVEKAIDINRARGELTKKLIIIFDSKIHGKESILQLKNILGKSSGSMPVYLILNENGTVRDFKLDLPIKLETEIINDIQTLLGDDSVKLSTF